MSAVTAPAAGHPSGDVRFKRLEAELKRHHYARHALIEVLHTAQELFGHLDVDLLHFIARQMRLPPSRVYGVATFYHFFSLVPKGRHQCVVCTGTACYVKGSAAVLAAVGRLAGVRPGETTADGRLSLASARCLGACGIAPAVVFDGTVCGHQTAEGVCGRVRGWLA
jgi:bidirectional [NiFe] hydrogenase diaphorase subunit